MGPREVVTPAVVRAHHPVVRRRLAILALVFAAGSCELPKPPIPNLPGDASPGPGAVASVPRAVAGAAQLAARAHPAPQ